MQTPLDFLTLEQQKEMWAYVLMIRTRDAGKSPETPQILVATTRNWFGMGENISFVVTERPGQNLYG